MSSSGSNFWERGQKSRLGRRPFFCYLVITDSGIRRTAGEGWSIHTGEHDGLPCIPFLCTIKRSAEIMAVSCHLLQSLSPHPHKVGHVSLLHFCARVVVAGSISRRSSHSSGLHACLGLALANETKSESLNGLKSACVLQISKPSSFPELLASFFTSCHTK